MEDLEEICFKIISNVGGARSSYIEAIQKAKQGSFEEAQKLINQGQEQFLVGHEAHLELFQQDIGNSLLVIHAEDQLMSAEGFKIIAQELIDSYKRIQKLENK